MTQQTFAIDDLIREADVAAAPEWEGAPLRYHEDPQWSPEDLDAAWDRYIFENDHHGCIPRSHMWHRSHAIRGEFQAAGHTLNLFDVVADSRYCSEYTDHVHAPGDLPEDYRVLGICTSCGWREIARTTGDIVEHWHDHAMPGWRNLPTVPEKLRGYMGEQKKLAKLHAWIAEHYPLKMHQPGYPILSERGGFGTRHIPYGSPWGGYDLSDHALEEAR
ncbi:MAG: DUF6349 family protein [Leucobacter sp.]